MGEDGEVQDVLELNDLQLRRVHLEAEEWADHCRILPRSRKGIEESMIRGVILTIFWQFLIELGKHR